MYELFVLACLHANPGGCITLQDLYGPHNTHDKCLARAYEISQGIPVHMPEYFARSYKCIDMQKSKKIGT